MKRARRAKRSEEAAEGSSAERALNPSQPAALAALQLSEVSGANELTETQAKHAAILGPQFAALRSSPSARARAVWTPERLERVCLRLAEGAFVEHACMLDGHRSDSLYDVAKRNPEVAEAIVVSRALGIEHLRGCMARARPGEDDWKKYAWWMERLDRNTLRPPTQTVDVDAVVDARAPLAVTIETARALARRGA